LIFLSFHLSVFVKNLLLGLKIKDYLKIATDEKVSFQGGGDEGDYRLSSSRRALLFHGLWGARSRSRHF